jgi:aerobic-type carbon monoxide dehydrogenase small subunit (CoxS/CutS family)
MTGDGLTEVTMRVNGVSRTQLIDPRMSLLDLPRERLSLTGWAWP